MKQYDTLFLDRDGTLNPDPGYIRSLEQFSFFYFALPALNKLSRARFRFCIITNQSGVGRGLIKLHKLQEIHQFITSEFDKNDINLLGIYQCSDHPERATEYRKPGPGMFNQAAREHGIVLENSLMIGDAVSDIEAGVNLKMDTMLVLTGKGEDSLATLKDGIKPTYVVKNLLEGADLLMK